MRRRAVRRTVNKGKIIFILILLSILIIYLSIENQIETGIIDITKIKAEELCNDAVNTAVVSVLDENEFIYGDFAEVTSNDNSVISIGTNTVNANKLKSLVALKAQQNINDMCGMQISYKFGDFCGSELLSGRGPDVVIQLYFSSSVTADIENEFESCGVNQTKHTLNMIVTSKVYITSQKNLETYTTVVTTVPIAENIIVGNTPSVYLNK